MRWLIFALLSVALVTLGVIVAGGRHDGGPDDAPAEAPDVLAAADALDERLVALGTDSRELSGFFSETGIGEQLDVLDSRLRTIKLGILRVKENAASEDPLVRDAAGRELELHTRSLDEQERRFKAFGALFDRIRPQFVNAFGRLGQVNGFLQRLIDIGTPCPDEQATAREVSITYRNGRRFFFGELGKVLDGKEPDETVLEIARGAFQQTWDDLQPLFERLQPVTTELDRIASQEKTITARLEWARGVRGKLGDDPWLAEPEADLDARAAVWRTLHERADVLRAKALEPGFVADARVLVEDMAALLRVINVYVSKARQAGLPLPR